MPKLPDSQTLAGLVSNVTRTMCGVSFAPGDAMARGESICRRMAMISLRGDPNVVVVVASDARGSRALGAKFFGRKLTDITQQMADDAIAELLNMVAAQISNALGSTHQLGLPSQTTLPEITAGGGFRLDDAALLHSEGDIDLGLWILESPAADARAPAPRGLRSLLHRFR
ncbi:MAG TPA: chemotaxis protein CheX [Polyangia bacterium]|jgi:CheY-specific phosphatase CheX|nr:chemotaxis protein CheX [Polyangia bacterium]